MKDFFELVTARESCRNYDRTKPVEEEKLHKIIETVRLAPSSCNSQPWHFTVVNSPDMSPKIAKCIHKMGINKFTSDCPAFIIISEEKANLSATVGGKINGQNYSGYDIGIAVAHICFSAQSLGLSTCIIGWFDEKKLRDTAGIAKNKKINLVISIGYAADNSLRPKKRKDINEIATFIK